MEFLGVIIQSIFTFCLFSGLAEVKGKPIYIFYARHNNGRLTCLRSLGVMTRHGGSAGKVREGDRRKGRGEAEVRRGMEREKGEVREGRRKGKVRWR